MNRLLVIGGLFVLAGLCEIGGGYLVWGWKREHKPLLWALLGALVLATYGVVAALQPISGSPRSAAATSLPPHRGAGTQACHRGAFGASKKRKQAAVSARLAPAMGRRV